jgi:uncharacterized protein YbcI
MPESDNPFAEQPPDVLVGDRGDDPRARISNAIVALMKRFYGKGPERARTYIVDDYVFCAMEGGLTRSEETLVEAGKQEAVRNYRLLFEQVMTETLCGAVAEILQREVIGYHSQITFNPTRAFEIFILGGDGPRVSGGPDT